jgi:hypothetical protein
MRTQAEQTLVAYIGAYGLRASRCDSTAHLCEVAAVLFAIEKGEELAPTPLAEMLTALGKKERSRRARLHMKRAERVLRIGGMKPSLDDNAEAEWRRFVGKIRGKMRYWPDDDQDAVRAYMEARHGIRL